MLTFSLTLLVASTPAIEEYLSACPNPVTRFDTSARTPRRPAPAGGVVTVVSENRVELKHCFFENHRVIEARTRFEGELRPLVSLGEIVRRGQEVVEGRVIAVTLEGERIETFARRHVDLWAPHDEAVLVVVDVDGHRAVRLERGHITHEWEVGHGQREGVKERQGDLRTPRGLYFVVERSTGPFVGSVAEYFGGIWVKLNYPNAFDAERGRLSGLLSDREARRVGQQWRKRQLTAQGTRCRSWHGGGAALK